MGHLEALSIDGRHSKKKPRILLYSSCVATQLWNYLMGVREVADHFAIDVLQIHVIECSGENRLNTFRHVFSAADFVFTNCFSPRWHTLGLDSVRELMGSHAQCRTWTPPNFRAFWPVVDQQIETGVDAMIAQGATARDIVHAFRAGTFDPKFSVLWDEQILRLRTQDAPCDIRICDFVERYYKEVKLWFTSNHPTWPVVAWLGSQIVNSLGYASEGQQECAEKPADYNGFWNTWPETDYEFKYYGFAYPKKWETTPNWGGVEWYEKQIQLIYERKKVRKM